MTVYNRYRVNLFTECATKLTILMAFKPDHELVRYHEYRNSIFVYNKRLIEFMRRFCPECTNPDTPSLFHLFVACRAFQAVVDDAILTELVGSAETITPALTQENSGLLVLLSTYKEFVDALDDTVLVQE